MCKKVQYKWFLVIRHWSFLHVLIPLILCGGSSLFGQNYFQQLGSVTETSQVIPYEVHAETSDLMQPSSHLVQSSSEDRYNLAFGPIRFSASAGIETEWTDNLAFSSVNREADFIFTPTVNLDAKWRVTELNTLHFSLGLGYSYYLQHTQYDSNGITISPNSELAFTIHVGNLAFTMRDQFSLLNDPNSLTTLSSTNSNSNFQRFQNQTGLTTDWIVNPILDLKLTYDHFNLWVLGNNLAGSQVPNQIINTVVLNPRLKVGPAITAGLNLSASYIQYTGSNMSGQTMMVGPLVELALTRNSRLNVGVGYQYFGGVESQSGIGDSNSIYSRVSLENRLNTNFSHQLTYTHTTEAGYTTPYYNLYDLQYAAHWRVNSAVSLDLRLIYQHDQTPGTGGWIGNRYGSEIGTHYQLTPSIALGLNYRYFLNTKNTPDSNATQNSVLFNIFYSF